jgi:hypothetical protein
MFNKIVTYRYIIEREILFLAIMFGSRSYVQKKDPDSVGQNVAVYSRTENPTCSSPKLILIEDVNYT